MAVPAAAATEEEGGQMRTKLTLASLAIMLLMVTAASAQNTNQAPQSNMAQGSPGTASGPLATAKGSGSVGNDALVTQDVVSARAGGINAADGDVTFKRGQDDWKAILVGDQMKSGDHVRTGPESRAEILLTPGSYLRLAANTEVSLDNTALDQLKVSLLQGSVIVEAAAFDKLYRKLATISTPEAQISIDHRGVYRFNVNAGFETVEVEKGKLSVNGKEIAQGKKVSFDSSAPQVQSLGSNSTDWFDQWSQQRAESLFQANSSLQSPTATAPSVYGSPFSAFYGSPLGGYGPFYGGLSAWGGGCGGSWYFNPFFGGYTYLPGLFDASFGGNPFFPCYGAFSGYGFPYRTLGYYHRKGIPVNKLGPPGHKPTLAKIVTGKAGTMTAKSGILAKSAFAGHSSTGGHASSGGGGGHSSGGGGGHSGGGGGGGGHR
jgi:hypothetical protein